MQSSNQQSNTDGVQEFLRTIAVPAGLATISVGTGTVGHFLYLSTLEIFSDASTVQILAEGFFRSLEFLVLGLGEVQTEDSLSYALLTVGRIAGALFVFYAALAGIGIVFAEQLRRLRIEVWSLIGSLPGFEDRGHVIVCGVGDDGYALATEALENGRNVVAVDTKRSDRTEDLAELGAVTFEADASHRGALVSRARVHLASEVFVTAGSDATNGAIVESINRQASDSAWPQILDVTARIDDTRLRRTLHEETTSTDGIHLRTYDESEATARELLTANPIDDIDIQDQRIHVWLVGWTPLCKSIVRQLLHLMHYPEEIERQITIITDMPAKAEQEITALSPGIDPDWWDDESMSSFTDKLFPNIDVQPMPASDMALLSDKLRLYDSLKQNDKLTIIADDSDERSLRALISVWNSKLDEVAREFDLDAHLLYRSSDDTIKPATTSEIRVSTYTAFRDGCSIRAIRGEERDRNAKRLALVYHLLYNKKPSEALPGCEEVPDKIQADIDSVAEWIELLPQTERERYADAIWRNLPEYQRESNRHASDHAAVKYRMASILSNSETTTDPQTVRALAETEHRRWCAEKILDGWEPVPPEKMDQWETDTGEQALRDQRYHADIRTVEALRAEMDGEWDKDVSQVRAVLDHPEILGV